ncbi:MAG: hypothetical protein ACRC7N_17500 [Clostridium sp.]
MLLLKYFQKNFIKNKGGIIQLILIFFMFNMSVILIGKIQKEERVYERYGSMGTLNQVYIFGDKDCNEDFYGVHNFLKEVRNYDYIEGLYLLRESKGEYNGQPLNLCIINKEFAERYYKNENLFVNDKEGIFKGYLNRDSKYDIEVGDEIQIHDWFKDSMKNFEMEVEGIVDPLIIGTGTVKYDVIMIVDDTSEIKYTLTEAVERFFIEVKNIEDGNRLKEDIHRDYSNNVREASVNILNEKEIIDKMTSISKIWIGMISSCILVMGTIVLIGLTVWIYNTFSVRKYEYGIRLYMGSTKKRLITLIMSEMITLYTLSYLCSWIIVSMITRNKFMVFPELIVSGKWIFVNFISVILISIITLILVCIYVNKINIGKVVKGNSDAN